MFVCVWGGGRGREKKIGTSEDNYTVSKKWCRRYNENGIAEN